MRKGRLALFDNRLSAIAMAGCLALLSLRADAGDLGFHVSGNLVGVVVDPEGTPAIGASVQLFNKFERLLGQTRVDLAGSFAFPDLPADVYTVRISAASYLPISRDHIEVKPGTDSLLQVHLATLLSTVRISYHNPGAGMSNDWKWVLRSSPATRPIVRYLPQEKPSSSGNKSSNAVDRASRVFTNTRAVLSISGGDASVLDADSTGADLGTAFAVSTNVIGNNRVQLGGTYAPDPIGSVSPSMSLTALYTRSHDSAWGPLAPEVSFTVSQFSILPGQNAGAAATSAPQVRTMSIGIYQAMDVGGAIHVEYGMVGQSVDYLQHGARVSPFARVTVPVGRIGEVIGSFSDGDRPEELLRHQPRHDPLDDVEGEASTVPTATSLASVPEVSYRDGRLELQRTHSLELGYQIEQHSRTYALSAFTESVTNGRVHVAGDMSGLNPGDLLSDGVSDTSVYNIGAYQRTGALLSVDQHLGDAADFSVAYGRMGGLTPNGSLQWNADSPGSLLLDAKQHAIASANLAARVPKAGTRLFASYGWADRGAILPAHVFTTQNSYVSPGLNLVFKQPLPQLFGMPGRLLFTADLRNLLAQGYVPVTNPSGQTMMLVQAPRTVRGGLNFIF